MKREIYNPSESFPGGWSPTGKTIMYPPQKRLPSFSARWYTPSPGTEFQNNEVAMMLKGQHCILVILDAALWQNHCVALRKIPRPWSRAFWGGAWVSKCVLCANQGWEPSCGKQTGRVCQRSGLHCDFQLIDDRHVLCTAKFECIRDIKFPCSECSIIGQMSVSERTF